MEKRLYIVKQRGPELLPIVSVSDGTKINAYLDGENLTYIFSKRRFAEDFLRMARFDGCSLLSPYVGDPRNYWIVCENPETDDRTIRRCRAGQNLTVCLRYEIRVFTSKKAAEDYVISKW